MRHEEPADYDVFWGDFHKHMTGPDTERSELDAVVRSARQHLDVSVVQCYPFKWRVKGRIGGIREESTGGDPEFEDWWDDVQSVSERHNQPGTFVTIPAYEWHGNRTRWGDHNVYYREEGYPIDDAWELPDLLSNMADREALVLPHHTAYEVGNRGKDWDVYDPDLSPVTEVYSSHGSSEAVDSPVPMRGNDDMGPRTGGGTYRDGLDRGHRVGAIASNDGPGLPGAWGHGLAGVWASELTRDGIWEALKARRTYGVTGDRIRLWWTLDGHPIGSELAEVAERTATVHVDCPRPLDRVDLVHDGEVIETYTHGSVSSTAGDRRRVLVEMGWGPTGDYGDFETTERSWSGTVSVRGGTVTRVQPRFRGFGNAYELADGECRFDVTTARDDADGILPEGNADRTTQAFVFEVDGCEDAELAIDLDDGETLVVSLADARTDDHLFAFTDASARRLEDEFELDPDEVANPDVVYHTAHKVRVSRAVPVGACAATVTFEDLPATEGRDYYYVRAAQRDGQYAWTSPIWVTE